MAKNIKKLAEQLKEQLTNDILWRYNNSEYWDTNIIESFEQDNKLDKEELNKIMDIMFIKGR